MSAEREFVAFFEKNSKENETFIFYLQWTDNEDEIKLLETVVSRACYDEMDGHYVMIAIDTSVRLPESVVDTHCRIRYTVNSYHSMFTKCVGKFKCPLTSEQIESVSDDGTEMACLVNETFYSCRIKNMFTPSE